MSLWFSWRPFILSTLRVLGVLLRTQGSAMTSVKLFGWALLEETASSKYCSQPVMKRHIMNGQGTSVHNVMAIHLAIWTSVVDPQTNIAIPWAMPLAWLKIAFSFLFVCEHKCVLTHFHEYIHIIACFATAFVSWARTEFLSPVVSLGGVMM